MRRAALAAVLAVPVAIGTGAGTGAASPAPDIIRAEYTEPTTRYGHGALGEGAEWGALRIGLKYPDGALATVTVRLPENRVFEDIAPRLVDIDSDGLSEVMVVESDLQAGSRLAFYSEGGLIAATPFIGTRNRWLAPLGVVDLDGDGDPEIAWVDRPHLAKILRIWRFRPVEGLVPVAAAEGFSNHRFGEGFFQGGVRACAGMPELVMADAGWTRVMAATLREGRIVSRDLGPYAGPESIAAALACRDPG